MSTPERDPSTHAEPLPPLPFERWAEVSARLLKRNTGERLDILEELEIDPAAWGRHDRHWVTQLADDLDRDDDQRPERYAAICAEEMRARKKETLAPDVSRAAASKPPAEPPAAPPPAFQPAPLLAALTSPSEDSVAPHVVPSPVEAPPLAASPPAVSQPAMGETVMNFVMPVPGRALPFGDKPSPVSPPARPAPKPGLSGGTMPAPMNLKAMVTPFMEVQKPPKEASLPVSTEPKAVVSVPPTLPASNLAPASPRPAVLEMTLDVYASLCAEMVVHPERRADVLRRYGIADDASLRALHTHWKERFAQEPALESQWQDKYKTFRDWLAQKR